jgi:hypothetical protein
MKDLFTAYRKPTEEDFAEMWRLCIFAFDANVLLNIYRYTPDTQKKFFTILERLKERLWVSHQAASEYLKRREDVIQGQLKVYDDIAVKLENDLEKLAKQLEENYKRHSSIRIEPVVEQVRNAITNAKKSLEKDKEAHPDFSDLDPLRDKVVGLFEGKTGTGFSDARLAEVYAEAEERFKVLRPPGFSDVKNKGVPEKYGDVVIWFELMEEAKARKLPFIFVTDDRKEDWWVKKNGKTTSPRPELLEEFGKKTNGSIYIYQSEQFIEYAFKFFDIEDARAAVEEVQEVRKQDEAREAKLNTSFERVGSPRAIYRAVPTNSLNAIQEAMRVASLVPPSTIEKITHDLARQTASYLKDNATYNSAVEAARLAVNRSGLDKTVQDLLSNAAGRVNKPVLDAISDQVLKFNKPVLDAISNQALKLNKPVLDAISEINRPAMEAARQWQENLERSGLRGQRFHRSVNIAVSPTESFEAENADAVTVEVLLYEEPEEDETFDETDENVAEGFESTDESSATEFYEFADFPFEVTLVHRRGSENSFETRHRLRKPAPEEWINWGEEIEYTRRYWSPEEIDEHNANKGEDEEDATVIFNDFYSEWEANRNFYNRIISEIAGVRLDETDEFPLDQFRRLSPEAIDQLRFDIKDAVISSFYESYCRLRKTKNLAENENLIRQQLSRNSKSYTIDHILRKVGEQESLEFRTRIIKGFKSLDEDGKGIIVLKLNLRAAVELYDKLVLKIENATVKGQVFHKETRDDFLKEINPIHKLRVLEPHLDINAWYFKIDDIVF